MDILEYEEVKNFNYEEYCEYLQIVYGEPPKPYFCTPECNSTNNKANSRTSEGLMIHHIKENTYPRLSDQRAAKLFSFDCQMPKNLIYCDYLEHMLLHILICEEKSKLKINDKEVMQLGYHGLIQYIIPEINEIYSRYFDNIDFQQEYRKAWASKIAKDIDVYKSLLKRCLQIKNHYYTITKEKILLSVVNNKLKTIIKSL